MTPGPTPPDPGSFSPVVLAPGMVSLDWLTLNLKAPTDTETALPWDYLDPVPWYYDVDPGELAEYRTEPTVIRTAQFATVCYLCDMMGEKVATIWANPHNPMLHGADWIQVQFSNATLYSGEWVKLFRMFRAMGCEYTAISRVDIACDGIEGSGGDFPQVVQMSNEGTARYYGKCDWLTRTQRRTVIGAEFGSKRSNKFIRAYRKKREMKAKGVKQHIVDAWCEAFGFDVWAAPVEVNRFEVSLKGKEVRRHFESEGSTDWVEALAHPLMRVDVFASMAPKMFDFRTPAERSRDAVPVCRWDWSAVSNSPDPLPREKRTLAMTEHTIKTGLRSMFHVATVTGDRSGLEACAKLAAASNMADWYDRKRSEWLREFARIESAKDPRTLDILRRLRNPPKPDV